MQAQSAAAATASAPRSTSITAADSAAIRAAALDYIDGWYAADGPRMTRALHPELAKRYGDPFIRSQHLIADQTYQLQAFIQGVSWY